LFGLLADWRLNLCPEIIATVQREMLTGAISLALANCLRIGAIDLIPEGMGVDPHPNVHLVVDCVKHLPRL